MNAKQRMLNAMNGQPVDRVPVAFYRHFPDQTDNTVSETIRWAQSTRSDMVLVASDGFYPLMSDPPLQTMEQWKAFRPYNRSHPYITIQLDRCRRIVDAIGDTHAIFICAFTPMAHFKHTIGETLGGGQTRIMEFWNAHRSEMLQVFDVLEENNFILLDELKKAGLDGLMLSLQNCEKWRFSREDYMQYLHPYDARFVEFANQNYPNTIGHLCSWETGNTNACIHLDLFRDYDLQSVNWGIYQRESMSMAEGKAYFRKAKSVMGGFDRNTTGVLYGGSESEIKAFTKDLIARTGQQGFILSADCSINMETPDEHIRWVVEAAEEYAAQNGCK